MRKTLSLLLASTLAATLGLAGCTPAEKPVTPGNQEGKPPVDPSKPEAGATLKVWESEGPEGEFMKKMAEQFEAKHGVKVTVEPVPHTDTRQKLELDGPAGVGADVFAAPHDHLGALLDSNLVKEATQLKDADKFVPDAIKGTSSNGKQYGYPTAVETYVLFYNKKLVQQPAKTWDEISKLSKEKYNPAQGKYAVMWEAANVYFNHAWVAGFGANLFGPNHDDKNTIGLDSPEAIKGAEFYKTLQALYPVKAQDASADALKGKFGKGEVPYVITGPWEVKGFRDAKVDFGVAPLPELPEGKKPVSFSGIRAFYVSAYSKFPRAAQLFASFITNEENMKLRGEMTNQIPTRTALQDAAVAKDDVLKGILEQSKSSSPMPNITEMGQVWTPYAAALSAIWDGKQAPADAMKQANQNIKDAIAQQK